MPGKDFNIFQMLEEVMKMAEEVSANNADGKKAADEGTASRANPNSRRSARSSDRRTSSGGPSSPDLKDVLGFAALGLGVYAQHKRQQNDPRRAKAKAKQQSNQKKSAIKKAMLGVLTRETQAASRDRVHTLHRFRTKLTEKERSVKRRAILAVNPSQEQLIDPIKAKSFFGDIRTQFADARKRAIKRVEDAASTLAKNWHEIEPGDTDFETQLEHHIAAWVSRDDGHERRFMERVQKLEGELAHIRASIERGAKATASAFGDTRFLYAPQGLTLNEAELDILGERVLQPRNSELASLFSDLKEGRIDLDTIKSRVERFAWDGAAIADILERASLSRNISKRFGFSLPGSSREIKRFGDICLHAALHFPSQEVPLSGEDALRVAAMFVADFESNAPFMNSLNWPIVARVTGQMPEKLGGYVTREEAVLLYQRLADAALREIEPKARSQTRGRLFAPFANLLRELGRIALIENPAPALALWDAFLVSRRAAREEVLQLASPFWRPMMAEILDATRADDRIRGQKQNKVYNLIKGFGDFNDAQQKIIVRDVQTILQHSARITLASRDDDWITNVGRLPASTIAGDALVQLLSALDLEPGDRAAYFAPLIEIADLDAFAPMFEAQKKDRSNALLQRKIGDLLRKGDVEKAERKLRRWLERAPASSVRDAVLATELSHIQLGGWDGFRSVAKNEKVDALQADFSGHCLEQVTHGDSEVVVFEDGSVALADFDFASRTLDELREIARTHGTPWQGAMDIHANLEITGLAPTLRAIARSKRAQRPDRTADHARLDSVIYDLAEWWCFAAFASAVSRQLSVEPLPRKLPVVLGTHSFGFCIPEVIL